MEEFIGFTFNNIHSSSLGIQRMSKGGLISQPFLPTIQDKVEDQIRADGSVYLGTKQQTLSFEIDFVYGPIGEASFQAIKSFCESKTLGPLIFDETPNKIYTAKISGSALSSYNVFGDSEEKRYIGTGQLTFMSYTPYATGKYLYIEEIIDPTPSWMSGKIMNIDRPYSAILAASEEDINMVSQILGNLKIVDEYISPTHFIGELKIDETSYQFEASVEQELLDALITYKLPSQNECGVQKENNNTYFVIDNVGDTTISVSPMLVGRGEMHFYMDNQFQCTVENWEISAVKMDSDLNAFINTSTNKIATNCRMVRGSFLKIPPGKHKLSLKVGDTHSWNSALVSSVQFRYQYV